VFALQRALGPDRGPIRAWITRHWGFTKADRIARENIAAAFPAKPAAERAAILAEAWDNLGRVACEYVHMDRIWDFDLDRPEAGRITATPETIALYNRLRDDGKPAIVFSAHLANWELPAIAAAKHGIASAVLYRTPNSPSVAKAILELRRDSMGHAGGGGHVRALQVARRWCAASMSACWWTSASAAAAVTTSAAGHANRDGAASRAASTARCMRAAPSAARRGFRLNCRGSADAARRRRADRRGCGHPA